MDDQERQEFERLKLAVESVKHITTLATGTIVLAATFSGKASDAISGEYFACGIMLMIFCVMGCFSYLWVATIRGFPEKEASSLPDRRAKSKILRIFGTAIYFCFSLGLASLGVFAVSNVRRTFHF